MIIRLLLHAVAAFAARDHRGSMCSRCKDGALVDGGTRTVRGVGCVHWCSHAGYCGDGDSYRRGLDCRHRADVDPETLARATKEAEAQRNARYDATFVRHHGAKTFEQYKRGADHGELYGAAISIRGERHCGTGWVRVMTNENCRERHYWSPKLDADGLYGWKHDFLPESFAAASRDAVVVVFRCAAPWAVKMRKTAYSGAIDRLGRGAGLQAFLSTRFVERGVAYAHVCARAVTQFFFRRFCSTASGATGSSQVLELRTRKYAQYLRFGRSHRNVLGARYEDLTQDPEFLFRRLKALGYACNARDDFKRVKAYAKFGGAGSGAHFKPPANHSWSVADWTTLVDRLDYENVEGALGYAYDRASPGSWAQHAVTPGAGALGPESGDDAPVLEAEPPAPIKDEPSAASPPAGGLFRHLRGGDR